MAELTQLESKLEEVPARPGTFERARDGRYVLRYERRLAHPPACVWSALAEPDQLAGWLAEADLEPRKGGHFELRWLNTDDEGNRAIARGIVTKWEPPRILELDSDIDGVIRWDLGGDGDGTRLLFSNITLASNEYLTKVPAGWEIHLDYLEDALDGRFVDWAQWSPEYVAPGSGRTWNDYERAYA